MKLQPKDTDEIEMDMSPMIDMVFLLLIFFLVASTVIEEKVPIEIPSAVHAKVPENISDRVTIAVNEDDEIFFGTQSKPLSLGELELRLATEVMNNSKLKIQIRSGGGVKYGMNDKILKACGEAGATNLIYAAYEE